MAEPTDAGAREPLDRTTKIVAAFVRRNTVAPADLPSLIAKVHAALDGIATGKTTTPETAPLKPAVPIRRSITPDYLISLEDGRSYKSLKRHLSTKYGMTPDDYRAKWGLPKDYPMVAPNYAATRSALAKQLGFGKGGRKPAKRRAGKSG